MTAFLASRKADLSPTGKKRELSNDDQECYSPPMKVIDLGVYSDDVNARYLTDYRLDSYNLSPQFGSRQSGDESVISDHHETTVEPLYLAEPDHIGDAGIFLEISPLKLSDQTDAAFCSVSMSSSAAYLNVQAGRKNGVVATAEHADLGRSPVNGQGQLLPSPPTSQPQQQSSPLISPSDASAVRLWALDTDGAMGTNVDAHHGPCPVVSTNKTTKSAASVDSFLWVSTNEVPQHPSNLGKALYHPQSILKPLLHIAAESGKAGIVRLLLERGFDVDEKDNTGSTALHRAAIKGDEAMMQELVRSGAHVDEPNGAGWTAIHLAAANGFEAGLSLLLQCGADATIKVRGLA